MKTAVSAAKCGFVKERMLAINKMKEASLYLFLKSNTTLFIERVNHKNESIEERKVRVANNMCDLELPCCGRGEKTIEFSIALRQNVSKCKCKRGFTGSYCQDILEDSEELPESEALRRERALNATIAMAKAKQAQLQAEDLLYRLAQRDQAEGMRLDGQRERIQREAEEREGQHDRRNISEYNKNMTRNNSYTLQLKRAQQLNKTKAQMAEAQQREIHELSVSNAIESGVGKAVCVGPSGMKLAPGMVQSECCGHGSKISNTSSKCNCVRGYGGDDCSYLCEPSVECCGNGRLNGTGACKCSEGFSGNDCAVGIYCSGNGFRVDGVCICKPGWKGENCTNQTAIATSDPEGVEDTDDQRLIIAGSEAKSASAGNKETITASEDDIEKGFANKPNGKGTEADLKSSNKTEDLIQRAAQTQAGKDVDQQHAIEVNANISKKEALRQKAETMIRKTVNDVPTLKTNSSSTEEQVLAANEGIVKTLAQRSENAKNTSMYGNEKVVTAASNLAQGLQLDGSPTLAQQEEMDANVTGKALKIVSPLKPVQIEVVQNKTKVMENRAVNVTANANTESTSTVATTR